MTKPQNGSLASTAIKMFARPQAATTTSPASNDELPAIPDGSDMSTFAYAGTTAAQNAAGRTPKQIIDQMLQLSARIGEPVTLRLPITPAMATYLLSLNEQNRRVRPIKLEQYVDDMKAGRWKENGDTIAIADIGLINDGQHRCMAVEQSGVTIIANVTVGLERAARGTNDIGAMRSPANMLEFAGHTNGNTLAAIARAVISYSKANGETMGRPGSVSTSRIVDDINSNSALIDATTFARQNQKYISKVVSATIIGFMRYLTYRMNPGDSDAFFEGVFTGAIANRGLDVTDPRYVTRERLRKVAEAKKSSNTLESVEVLFRGWNAFREKRPIEVIKVLGKLPQLR